MAGKYEDLLKLAQAQEQRSGVPAAPPQGGMEGMLQNLAAIAMNTGNPNTERGRAMAGGGQTYLTGLNSRNKQMFFNTVGQISSAPIEPAKKIELLIGLQAQHGTDYGLGLNDIVKSFSELGKQNIDAAGQEWKPKTKEDAIAFEEAKAGFKPPTQAQETTALYAGRMKQAYDQFEGMSDYIDNLPVIGTAINKAAPNFMKSAEWQSYEQAQRNFLTAVLRRESGAVISPTEFAEGRQQYFPMPGDKPAVLAQKKANRDLVVKNFIKAAGRAYEPYQQTGSGAVLTATNQQTGQKIKSLDGGQTWQPVQ